MKEEVRFKDLLAVRIALETKSCTVQGRLDNNLDEAKLKIKLGFP